MANNIQSLLAKPIGEGFLTSYNESSPTEVTTTFTGTSGQLTNIIGETTPLFVVNFSGDGTIEVSLISLSGSMEASITITSSLIGSKVVVESINEIVAIAVETGALKTKEAPAVASLLAQATGSYSKSLASFIFTSGVYITASVGCNKITSNGSSTFVNADGYVSAVPIHWGNSTALVPIQAIGYGEGIAFLSGGVILQSSISQKTNLKSEITQWQNFY